MTADQVHNTLANSYTQNPIPSNLIPKPQTLNPNKDDGGSSAQHHTQFLHPKSSTLNPQLYPLTPKP